ncbi:MAG: lipopolysaccharide biosynthesis protein [Muribaculum sp.]|nr:lipopolysaccharide biosynthesis protein [Muribaculum sp.]
MAQSLKDKTVKGLAWSSIERFSTMFIQLAVNIVLARILMPEDFGMVAMLAVFIQFSQAFIDSGFSNALIQRKNRTEADYCTVFYFTVAVSTVLYVLLYISAPYISDFYNMPQLTEVARVLGLGLIIGSLAAVHKTRLSIELKFKVQAVISLLSAVISGTISITMAYCGLGVWALVLQSLVSLGTQTLLVYLLGTRWLPSLIFSVRSFKELFGYSSKLLLSSLLHLLYRNLYPIVIGKRYAATELGYYNRADLLSSMSIQSITLVLAKVAFPIFSSIQDDNDKLRVAYSKYISYASLVVFPVMLGISALAKPLIVVAMTEKWLMAVPMLQILAASCIFDHITSINLNVLYVKGRSDLALRLEIIKKTIAISILFAMMPFGIIAICWGQFIYNIIATILNTRYTNMLIGLPFKSQMRDFMPYLGCSVLMAAIVWYVTLILPSYVLQLFIGIPLGVVVYVGAVYIFMRSSFNEFCGMICSNFLHK